MLSPQSLLASGMAWTMADIRLVTRWRSEGGDPTVLGGSPPGQMLEAQWLMRG